MLFIEISKVHEMTHDVGVTGAESYKNIHPITKGGKQVPETGGKVSGG